MKGLLIVLKYLGKSAVIYKKWIPRGSVFIYILLILVSSVYQSIIQQDASIALTEISQTVFAADYKIYEAVELAKIEDPHYTFGKLLDIINGVLILFYLTKFLQIGLIKISGSQAAWGATVWALIIVFILEFSTVSVTEDKFFMPFTGLWTLFINLPVVFKNINWKFWTVMEINETILTGKEIATNYTSIINSTSN